ncbi:DNA-binding winged helix-turn-helix (wHTH) protein [Polymorphobacter fuscus]|nr:transcriptional regulator [Polymorphobacter fuscus]NJC08220.1 DNA-binding winged helix-turn-helix (wHTH) protein [Polymorphobacter fuscus]
MERRPSRSHGRNEPGIPSMSISNTPIAYSVHYRFHAGDWQSTKRRSVARCFRFGPFTLEPERQTLLKDGCPMRIGGRALDILTTLVERPGKVVGKRELVSRVWPDTLVEEANLKVNVASLRRILGDHPATPQYIATVVGRGYRFVGDLRPSIHGGMVMTT